MFITCAAALVTFHATPENDPGSVVVGFALGAVFSLLFAVCFALVGHSQKQHRHTSVANICEDMDDVAERRGRPELRAPLSLRDEVVATTPEQ